MKMNAAAEMPPIPDKGYEPITTRSTFRDWGGQLPIGILQGGTFHRSIEFKPYTMAQERQISAARRKAKKAGNNPATVVTLVLSEMIQSIGPHADFASLNDGQRQLVINNLYMADAIAAYMLLRMEAMGDDLAFDITCPACGTQSRLPANLQDTDLTLPEGPQDLVRRHALRKPLNHGKQTVKTLLVQPPRWHAMSTIKAGATDATDIKLKLILASILGTEDGAPFAPSLLDDLTKRDYEMLAKRVDDTTLGPDLSLEASCPECGASSQTAMRWDFDHFFGASSL
jgi:endogenous inhibitor of DNA gyrase (YacG/DUF329 family)